MTFYVYVNSTWTQVYVEVEPQFVKAWDTTNDSFSCVLQASSSSTPYEPMTPFKIIDDSSNETIMWIINDTVTTFSLSPKYYKHTLSIVQYRYFLNKHLIRNTVFNQPRKKSAKLYGAISAFLNYTTIDDTTVSEYQITHSSDDGSVIFWTDYAVLGSKANVSVATYEIKLYGTLVTSQQGDLIELETLGSDSQIVIKSGATFSIIDYDNSTTIISGLSISNFGTKTSLTSSQISTLNSYLSNNPGVTLALAYSSGESGDTVFTDSFCEKYNTYLTGIYSTVTAQIFITFETYNYTMYDVLSTLLTQYRLYTSNYGYKRDKLFNLPTSGDLYELLTTTYPPDTLSFTQCTFYDALTEIFRFYDAGFKFDENQYLDIEYYNDPQTAITSINTGGISISHTDKNYNNGRVAYYQNALNTVKLKNAPTRSQVLGVPGRSDYGLVLPYPIYDIIKLEYVASFQVTMPWDTTVSDGNIVGSLSAFPLDISYFILNESEWYSLDKSSSVSGDVNTLMQITTIPFSRGSKFICTSRYDSNYGTITSYVLQRVLQAAICRFYGLKDWTGSESISFSTTGTEFSPAWSVYKNQVFNIQYLAMNNGRVETKTMIDHYAGEMLVNQGDGMVDLNKLGLNMLGESLKDGEPVLTATWEITDWGDRIQEGDYITYNSEIWVANVVNYTVIRDGVYQCTVEFSKNYNALSLRVQSDSQKRLTAISATDTVMSEDSYIDYVYVGDGDYNVTRQETALGYKVLESLLGQTFGLSSSYYEGYENVNFATVIGYINGSAVSDEVYMPLIKYGAGNCICFELQYDSPINAGNQLVVSSGWFGTDAYFSQVATYTNYEGWADYLTINFVADDYTFDTFPVISSKTSIGSLTYMNYQKKPNEIFGLNYEWCFLPFPYYKHNIFIGSAFINNNAFTNVNYDGKTFYLYYGTEEYTILDRKGKGTATSVTLGTQTGTNFVRLYILTTSSITAYAWSLCDSNGNIYFASNNTKVFTSDANETSALYFVTRRERADDDDYVELPSLTISASDTFRVSSGSWVEKTAESTITASVTITLVSTEGYGHGSGSYQSLILIGKSVSNLSISGSSSNTVSYDSTTGTFTYTIYASGVSLGDSVSATITYIAEGASDYYYYEYKLKVSGLVGQEITYSISPSTVTINDRVRTNSITFNSSTGSFYGVVYSEDATATTYTITYASSS